ncbi:GNAT family N-acetyltransferase [Bacillus thuringiensis]|uniref:GNAT family N-acetyltransferase n=1 Tax=Bacillus toyonensis TaxID=155322 RepID=UPI001298C2B9|nr:GNAT family N-acetyltransferase [Bacillus thuringiensis]
MQVSYDVLDMVMLDEDMYELWFEEIQKFNCSNDSMSNYLKQSAYYNYAEYEENTTLVIFDEWVFGYFTLKMGEIHLSNKCKPALEIKRLAIQNKEQNKNLGSMVIEYIEGIARQVNVRFIKLDGLKEYEGWYQKQGFKIIESNDLGNYTPTISMYKDLYDERLTEEYLEGR